jgi:GNAT superfamily N-acetyltransferase
MHEIIAFERVHLSGVMGLFAAERWSYAADQERTWRALIAPGSLTLVALTDGQIAGIAQTLSDGEVQAFLSILLVAAGRRGAGIGRALVQEALRRTPGIRFDLISYADGFYRALDFRPISGFRYAR